MVLFILVIHQVVVNLFEERRCRKLEKCIQDTGGGVGGRGDYISICFFLCEAVTMLVILHEPTLTDQQSGRYDIITVHSYGIPVAIMIDIMHP